MTADKTPDMPTYRRRYRLLLPVLMVSLCSCAEFTDQPLDATTTVSQLEAHDLNNPELGAFIGGVLGEKLAWPVTSWDVDSLTLAAIYFHPDMAIIRAQAQGQTAAEITAAQRPNPTLNTTPSYLTHLATTAMPWYAVSNLNIPIETAGKRGYRMDKAAHLATAAQLKIGDNAWLVRSRLRQAMLEMYIATEAEQLLQRLLTHQQAIHARLSQQVAVGELSRLELGRSQLVVQQMQLNLSTGQKRSAESRIMLANAIGLSPTALNNITLDFSLFAQPPTLNDLPIANLRTLALQQRADVLAALAEYDAAQSALQLEIANQYPNIQANPGYAWEVGENLWSLGTTLALPLWHQNQGLIAEAEARRQELAVRFQALQLRIISDIDKARAGLNPVQNKWQDVQKQIAAQQENVHIITTQLKVGETDPLAVLTVEQESMMVQRARLDILLENWQALHALEDSLRYPLTSTLTAAVIANAAPGKPAP